MNAWISLFAGPVLGWLADYYLAATLLLVLALVAGAGCVSRRIAS